MWTAEALHERREQILEVAARHGAHNVRVFGSVARGEADDDSDIDFLVELEPGRSLFDLAHIAIDLQERLKCPVDVAPDDSLHPRIRSEVQREAITL